MDRGLAVILTATFGGLVALQAPINALLSKETGNFPAALVSFIVGGAALLAIVVISGQVTETTNALHVPWYYLLGGLLGAAYVFTIILTVGSLGAGGVSAATITGQLVISMVADRFGWLGLEHTPLSVDRLLGVALLVAGTYLVVR